MSIFLVTLFLRLLLERSAEIVLNMSLHTSYNRFALTQELSLIVSNISTDSKLHIQVEFEVSLSSAVHLK